MLAAVLADRGYRVMNRSLIEEGGITHDDTLKEEMAINLKGRDFHRLGRL